VHPRHTYDIPEMQFPFSEIPQQTVFHAGEMYHSVFQRLFGSEEGAAKADRFAERGELLMEAVQARDDGAVAIEIEISDPADLERTAQAFGPPLVVAALTDQPLLVQLLRPHSELAPAGEALVLAASKNHAKCCVELLRHETDRHKVREAFVIAAARNWTKTVLMMVKEVDHAAKDDAILAAGARKYFDMVGLLMPHATDEGLARLKDLASFKSQTEGDEELLQIVEQTLGDDPDPRKWNVARVGQWLQDEKLHKFVKKFEEMEVDGAKLVGLTEPELKTLYGMKQKGPRTRMVHALEALVMMVPEEEEAPETGKGGQGPEGGADEASSAQAAEEAAAEADALDEEKARNAATETDPMAFIAAMEKAGRGPEEEAAIAAAEAEAAAAAAAAKAAESEEEEDDGDERTEEEKAEDAMQEEEALTTHEEVSFFIINQLLEIAAEQYAGWFQDRIFVDCTARSQGLAFAAALAKPFLEVRGLISDPFRFDDAVMHLRYHRQHGRYQGVLPEQRLAQEITFVPSDYTQHDWGKAYVVYFNTVNDRQVFDHLTHKDMKEKFRQLEQGSFVILSSNECLDPLLEGPGQVQAAERVVHDRNNLGRKASYNLPGFNLLTRQVVKDEDQNQGAFYVQLYHKALEKGEWADDDMMDLLTDA
jgi:hypothetical protein